VSALAYGVWALLLAAVLVLWLRSRTGASGVARPAQVVQRLATGPVWRVAFVVAVMFAGWHLFAR
jgi:type IV secretory pathway VirB2 component (pilin)